ncbi:MAG: carbon-nitrogen hydrolase family protein [Paracoccaceae bacterium]
MARRLHIACLQTCPQPDFAAALSEALGLAEAAVTAGAEFLALPEYCGGLKSEGVALAPPSAPEEAHPVLRGLCEFADRNRVWLLIGSIAVSVDGGKIVNRGYVVDDQGKIRSRYDKIHLFDVQLSDDEVYRESARVSPGSRAVLVETPFGSIGHTICYDLRFPGLYRDLALAGAEMLAVPSAFTRRTGEAHWHVLNRARAIENGCFVIAPCAIGAIPGGGESYGHSLVVSPWGEVVSDGGNIRGAVHAQVDLEQVAAVRARIPSLRHGRKLTAEGVVERAVA